MLEVNDLININYIPEEREISLSLLIDFYEQYLSKRVFIFTLENNEKVKLFFRKTSEIFHISGIDHIYEDVPMDGSRFVEEVKNMNMDINTLKEVNLPVYKDYAMRIRSMFCIDAIIKNCEWLYYSNGKIPNTDIPVTYLLLKSLDGKKLHLGIDTYKKGRPYFARTLLITEGSFENKFIERAKSCFKVSKLEIKDKCTDCLLECINRKEAELYVKNEVERITEKWTKTVFETELWNFFTNFDTSKNIISEMGKLLKDNKQSCFNDANMLRKVIEDNEGNIKISLLNRIKKQQKVDWIKKLSTEIEKHRAEIRQQTDVLDPYWAGKLVGEGIRRYKKEEIPIKLRNEIEFYLDKKSVDIFLNILQKK